MSSISSLAVHNRCRARLGAWMGVLWTGDRVPSLSAALPASILAFTIPAFLILATNVSPAVAQPARIQVTAAIDGLIEEGTGVLRTGAFEPALRKFQQAVRTAPKDPRGWFFSGMTLNRLGRFRGAMQALVRARALGFMPPQMEFEMGWGAVGIGRSKAAIFHLTAFEKTNPGSAKTSEFLGRAYFQLKQYGRAETYLREAVKRDPRTKSTALLYLARIHKARGDDRQASLTMAEVITGSPDSNVGRSLRDRLAERIDREAARGGAKKPWSVTVAVSVGHNDNVIGQSDALALPTDVSSQASKFVRTALDAGYSLPIGDNGVVDLGYGYTSDTYTGLSRFNSKLHSGFAAYQQRLTSDVTGSVRLFGDRSITAHTSTRNRIGVGTALSHRWDSNTVTEASYALGFNEYFATVPVVLDRDGRTHTFGIVHHMRSVTPFDVNVSVGYNHVFNIAVGDDYDYQSNVFFASVSRELFWKIRGGLSYIFSNDEYKHPNSQGAFVFRRSDRVQQVALQLSRPVTIPNVTDFEVFGRYTHGNFDSNIRVFKFDQNVVNIGVIKRF